MHTTRIVSLPLSRWSLKLVVKSPAQRSACTRCLVKPVYNHRDKKSTISWRTGNRYQNRSESPQPAIVKGAKTNRHNHRQLRYFKLRCNCPGTTPNGHRRPTATRQRSAKTRSKPRDRRTSTITLSPPAEGGQYYKKWIPPGYILHRDAAEFLFKRALSDQDSFFVLQKRPGRV